MGRRQEHTPTSQIKSALRKMWLRSRERAKRLKEDEYTCQRCGRKQSKAKGKELFVEVHHRDGVKWLEIISFIREHLLCHPQHLETICKDCHKDEHTF